jgi:hypothetical protein
MKSVEEIRRENLARERIRLGGSTKLAAKIGKNKNQVYQWLKPEGAKASRSIHRDTCREIEPLLGRPKGWLDIDHSDEQAMQSSLRSTGPELVAVRSKNHVKAMRFALQSLFSVLHDKMPKLAEDVAADIVETAGTEFSGAGFLNTLVGYLRGAEHTLGEEDLEPPQVQASQASRRAVSAAKKT